YEKPRKFCERAKEYDVEFVWSDTCYKSSRNELDASIHSRFRWHRNSTICIVQQSETLDPITGDG
ncbi:hypothetical protein BD769DRAFT_1342692, partial [Suillus cothurnatus]